MPVRKIRWAVIMRETWQCSPSSVTPYGRLFEICESVKLKETRGTRFVPIRNDRRTFSVKFRSACININTHKYIYIYFFTRIKREESGCLFKNIHQSWLPWTRSKSPRGSTARDACAPFADASSATKVMFHLPFCLFFFFFFLIKKLYFFISAIDKSWGPR